MHNSKTNCEAFRNQIEENLRLNIPLKEIEEAIEKCNDIIQKAAWNATPDYKPQAKISGIPMGSQGPN
jgi:hypothetical protein